MSADGLFHKGARPMEDIIPNSKKVCSKLTQHVRFSGSLEMTLALLDN